MCGTFFYYQDSSYVGLEFNIYVLKGRSNKYASHKGFTQPEKTERLSSWKNEQWERIDDCTSLYMNYHFIKSFQNLSQRQ